MIAVRVPMEVPGEDVSPAPFEPVPAGRHLSVVRPHDGWPPAYPDWEDYSPQDQVEHRSECPDTCGMCEAHRAWGDCSTCGAESEAVEGYSICCGSVVVFSSPVEDGPERLAVAS